MADVKVESAVLRSSPHALSRESVSKVMWSVVIALAPAALAACWFFGLRALMVIIGATLACVVFEYLLLRIRTNHEKALKLSIDGSAVITGILLAMNLPASSPWWLVVIGALIAMLLGKHQAICDMADDDLGAGHGIELVVDILSPGLVLGEDFVYAPADNCTGDIK